MTESDADLEKLVDRLEGRDDFSGAIEAQRKIIGRHDGTPPRDRGIDYERLGDLLLARYEHEMWEPPAPTHLRPLADEAYRTAGAWYLAAAGALCVDVLDMLAARMKVAPLRDTFSLGNELASTAVALDATTRDRAGALKAVRRGLGIALGSNLRQLAKTLTMAESKLSGEPLVSHEVEFAAGPPLLQFEPIPHRKTARAAVGRDPFEERFWLRNMGGPMKSLHVSLRGAAIDQELLGPPKITVSVRTERKEHVFRGRVDGDRLVATASVVPGAAVLNADRLRDVGCYGSELDDALSRCSVSVSLEAEARQRGKAAVEVAFAPAGVPERGVKHVYELTVVRPRVKAPPPGNTPPPGKASARRPTSPVIRRGRTRSPPDDPAPEHERPRQSARTLFARAESDSDLRFDLQRRVSGLGTLEQNVLARIISGASEQPESIAAVLSVDPDFVRSALKTVDAWLQQVCAELLDDS